MRKIKNNKGFTLIELILVIAIMGIVIQAIYSTFFAGTKGFKMGRDWGLTQEDFRLIREHQVKELRYVGYIDEARPNFNIYYSLQLKDNNDESYSLLKREYKNENIVSETIFPVKFKGIETNTTEGQLRFNIIPLNKSSNEFNFTILLENYLEFNKDINFSTEKEIYYAYPQDMNNDE